VCPFGSVKKKTTLERKCLMKHFAISLVILAGVAALSAIGQQAEPGSIVRNDPAIDKLVSPGTKVEKLHGGFGFIEGPIWVRSGRYLLFSDLPSNVILRWSPDGVVSVFRKSINCRQFFQGFPSQPVGDLSQSSFFGIG
jgi:gluconolactonase